MVIYFDCGAQYPFLSCCCHFNNPFTCHFNLLFLQIALKMSLKYSNSKDSSFHSCIIPSAGNIPGGFCLYFFTHCPKFNLTFLVSLDSLWFLLKSKIKFCEFELCLTAAGCALLKVIRKLFFLTFFKCLTMKLRQKLIVCLQHQQSPQSKHWLFSQQ